MSGLHALALLARQGDHLALDLPELFLVLGGVIAWPVDEATPLPYVPASRPLSVFDVLLPFPGEIVLVVGVRLGVGVV